MTYSAPLMGCIIWDRHTDKWALTYQQVDLCEVGLSSLSVNLKLLIVSGKQVGRHDSLNKPSLLVSHYHIQIPGHTMPSLLCLFNRVKLFFHIAPLVLSGHSICESQNWPKLLQTISLRQWKQMFPLVNCVCGRFWWSLSRAEQRELLWGAAEAWRIEQRSSDRHLSFIRFASSRCLRI